MTISLKILSSKAELNTWESFTRSELKLESVHQKSPRSDIFRKRANKPLLKQKHRQKHLTWAKEKKNWTVAKWSKILFSDESQFCISFVICWCWSTVFFEVHSQHSIYQDILEHFMLPSADKLYGDADFIFQQDLAPAQTAKGTKSWFNDFSWYSNFFLDEPVYNSNTIK